MKMRRCLHNGSPLLLLFILGQWPRIAEAGALEPGCVSVKLSDSKPVPKVPPRLDVTLTNNCGKDVTSASIRFRTANGDPPSGTQATRIEWLEALVVPADQRTYDILHSGQSDTEEGLYYPEKGLTASSLSASVTCVLFVDRTAAGDSKAIRDALDSRRRAGAREFGLRQQILAQISDFDAATVYFRDTHPAPGSLEDKYTVMFSQAFRGMSRVEWSKYIGQQIAIASQLITLFEEHSQLSAENH
jgi:hypothetical protein